MSSGLPTGLERSSGLRGENLRTHRILDVEDEI
jgi:hypothetical protein